MPQEIERKFLVSGEFRSLAYAAREVAQGYLCSSPERCVRVRISDGKGFLTIKGASDASGLSRYEWEREIPLGEARELMRLCEPGRIEKTRYLIRSGAHTVEVDEFHGDNEGLVVAEIELSDEAEAFLPPSFLGKEVTGDVRYYKYALFHKYQAIDEKNAKNLQIQ